MATERVLVPELAQVQAREPVEAKAGYRPAGASGPAQEPELEPVRVLVPEPVRVLVPVLVLVLVPEPVFAEHRPEARAGYRAFPAERWDTSDLPAHRYAR